MSSESRPLRIVDLTWLGWIKAPMVAFASGMVLLNLVTAADTALRPLGARVYSFLSFVQDWPNSTIETRLMEPHRWFRAVWLPTLIFLMFAAIIVVLRRACELRPLYCALLMGLALTMAGLLMPWNEVIGRPDGIATVIGVASWVSPFVGFFLVSLAVLRSRSQRIIARQPWSVLWTIYGTARARFRRLGLGALALSTTLLLFSAKLSVAFVGEYLVEGFLSGMIDDGKDYEAARSLVWTGLMVSVAAYEIAARRRFRGLASVLLIGAAISLFLVYRINYVVFVDDPRPLSEIEDETSHEFGLLLMAMVTQFDWVALVFLLRWWIVGRSLRPIEAWLSRMRLDAQEIMAATSKQPILFLRSFKDDARWTWRSFGVATWISGRLDARVRIEEIVAQAAMPRGPLIALSNPADELEPLGAARAQVSDEDWRDYVRGRIDDCRLVVCFLGDTENFRWEIDEILARRMVHKLIVVLPPSYLQDRSLTQTLPELANLLGLESLADERARLGDTKVVAWSAAEGGFTAIKSRWNNEFAYLDCIRLGFGLIVSQDGSGRTE